MSSAKEIAREIYKNARKWFQRGRDQGEERIICAYDRDPEGVAFGPNSREQKSPAARISGLLGLLSDTEISGSVSRMELRVFEDEAVSGDSGGIRKNLVVEISFQGSAGGEFERDFRRIILGFAEIDAPGFEGVCHTNFPLPGEGD